MAPVIPFLSDSPAQLRDTVRAIAASGATSVNPLVLHLRPGAREWFMAWLARDHPYLVRRYERLYADGSYAPKWYQRRIARQVHELAEEYGIGPAPRGCHADCRATEQPDLSEPTQLSLI
ncbi:Radical SAM protein OS=Streptomyces alboniger OX=132473 GN=CP975_29975 PE=4 SV=1 [Streptomyces alboniger]